MSVILRALAAASLLLAGSVREVAAAEFEDLGVQITSLTLQGTTFARSPDRRDLLCTVIRGEPAKLLVFDARGGQLLHRLPLEGAHGAWNAATASDGSVYVGADDNGHLYRWTPGQDSLRDLGQVAPDQTFAWDVTAGRNGEVFVSTYPGCQVIRYHPDDGFRDTARGSVSPGENYARGLAYEPSSGKVYVGVGAHAHLVEVDPNNGGKRDVLPAKYTDKKFVYSVRASGGKVFALLTDGTDCLVLDPASGQVDAVIPDVAAQLVVSPPSPHEPNRVYVKGVGKLLVYDLASRRCEPVELANAVGINAMDWLAFDEDGFPGSSLVIMTSRGGVIRYSPVTGKSSSTSVKPPPEATPIQSIARGPDGRIYCGGYLSGGLSYYDPGTGEHQQFPGQISQPESIGVLGSRLYLGLYPRARLYEFDTARPWDHAKKNPRQIEELDRFEQDRPFATLGVEKLRKVYFGTVSDYGVLGGTLTIYDPETGQIDVRRNIVQDQSVVSLAYVDDLIIGGTTISGGLGIEPRASEARLFLFDPLKGDKVYETTPVPGAWAITGLCAGPDHNIWGFADQKLFVFDPRERKVVYAGDTFPDDASTRHARWRNAMLELHPAGVFYGTVGGKLFRLDPVTRKLTVLRDKHAGLLAIDVQGRVYFRDRTNLWRYAP